MKRLFLAVPIPEPIRQSLITYSTSFREPQIKWVPPENYHLTVSFFGEQDEKLISFITEVAASISSRTTPFTLSFQDIRYAPPHKPATMLWAQYEPHPEFTDLVTQIESSLRHTLSFTDKREGVTPIPHITLARSKHFSSLAIPQIVIDSIVAEKIILYESAIVAENRVYTEIAAFPFQTA